MCVWYVAEPSNAVQRQVGGGGKLINERRVCHAAERKSWAWSSIKQETGIQGSNREGGRHKHFPRLRRRPLPRDPQTGVVLSRVHPDLSRRKGRRSSPSLPACLTKREVSPPPQSAQLGRGVLFILSSSSSIYHRSASFEAFTLVTFLFYFSIFLRAFFICFPCILSRWWCLCLSLQRVFLLLLTSPPPSLLSFHLQQQKGLSSPKPWAPEQPSFLSPVCSPPFIHPSVKGLDSPQRLAAFAFAPAPAAAAAAAYCCSCTSGLWCSSVLPRIPPYFREVRLLYLPSTPPPLSPLSPFSRHL